jgi:hypothetical protein
MMTSSYHTPCLFNAVNVHVYQLRDGVGGGGGIIEMGLKCDNKETNTPAATLFEMGRITEGLSVSLLTSLRLNVLT